MRLEHALLAAIHERPHDETNWLVLADWLEDQGEADRARLLRHQRRLRELGACDERATLEAQVQELLLAGVLPTVPTFTNSVGMELALVPAGKFWLGSPEDEDGRYSDESPRRLIELTRPFYLGVYPVMQQEYERVMGVNPSAFSPHGRMAELVGAADTRRHPVEEITWDEALYFCRRLAHLPGETARVYRLPTEAEWEYACRGGASLLSPFPYGPHINATLVHYQPSPRHRTTSRYTRPVDVGLPNGFGLHDMIGNTWEWCLDWYNDRAYELNPSTDPPGPSEGERRNVRGGNYNLETRRVRSADRSSFDPIHRDSDLGFRVLCEWPAC
ncbi:MAG: SUMF1/EgtB/PvdO family nonheme iron enzyme [Gemmataceae bacterium]